MTKWNAGLVSLSSLMLMSVMLIISGCATPLVGRYGENGQTKEEFTRYVEGVFKLQNSMTSEIMALLEADSENNHDDLLLAEQKMQQACGPLNEYASRESEGLNIGFFLSRRVEKSAIDCEHAAQKVKVLLRH
ncbi:hypothetical protein [Methylobacter sp. S3L5C]|uniref:hypothetical protein n=1 Tax=Methylobacter sp. S3L5C TaxID=2839024 RepID=UPI001FAD3069|nr:hypothetical protein [Methylobacter sp. S3L5C]UOA09148.1 hypothetical protein KKZ03_02165 [Methylobacter sp. S3L5C]